MRPLVRDDYAKHLVKVFADSWRPETCRTCGQPVLWVFTAIRRNWVLFDHNVRCLKRRRDTDGVTTYAYLDRGAIHWNHCAPIPRQVSASA